MSNASKTEIRESIRKETLKMYQSLPMESQKKLAGELQVLKQTEISNEIRRIRAEIYQEMKVHNIPLP